MITLAGDTITVNDIDALRDWLGTYPRLTKGDLTCEFEAAWSRWLRVKYSVFVNSGSSANLLAVYALMCVGKLKPGDAVAVPALSWATDLAPVIQLGLRPVLIDANIANLAMDPNDLVVKAHDQNIKAVISVAVLGMVPEMNELVSICSDMNMALIEDCCEAQGSRHEGRLLGTYGTLSTFSLFYGHQLSTIEGGMVCTRDPELRDILLSLRSHGWDRDWSNAATGFSDKFRFYYPGFNVRNTEIGAFLGLRQLKKLKEVVTWRSKWFARYAKGINNDYWHPVVFGTDTVSCFGYPVITPERRRLVKALTDASINCRPIISGSHNKQPMYFHKYKQAECPVADMVHDYGLYVPCNLNLAEEDVDTVIAVINGVTNA